MSTTDDRIVKLQFDNSGFEAGATKAINILEKLEKALNFESASAGIDAAKKAVDGFKMDSVSESVEECSSRFGAFEAFVAGVFMNLGSRVANFGLDLAKKVTLQPLMDGFSEYELQMRSVQTILSNAGDKLAEQGYTTQEEKIAVINDRLDELNKYADKTIYNFSEMTRNIGTFTAAGVDLDTATKSIQGIANLAAASGSSSQQASTAMYQLSQAIAAGSVKLQDWNSVVNAGMGGELFQNALKRTARNHGIAVDEMIAKNGSFRESLQEGWITSEVLTETLEQLTMSYGEVGDEAYNTNLEILKNQGYSEEDAVAILELAKNAEEAATKVRTWSQLWETVGEALGSGWATTWRLIVGDFLEATDLFTFLSERITGIIGASADARNAVLSDWAGGGGRTVLVEGIKYLVDAITSPIEAIGTAFSDVFGITGEQLYNITAAFATFAESLVPSQEAIDFLYQAFYDVFTVIHSVLGVVGNLVRVFFDVAGVVWKVISPFVKLGFILAGGVLKAIAWISAQIHLLTDYFEGFVSFITGHLGSAIDFIYGIFAFFGRGIAQVVSLAGGLGVVFRDVAIAIGQLIIESGPVKFVIDIFKSFYEIISEKVVGAIEKLKSMLIPKPVENFAKSFANLTPLEKFEYIIEDIAHNISKFFEDLLNAKDKIAFLKDVIGRAFDDIKDKIQGFFSVLSSPRELYDFIERVDSAIVDGIFSIFGNNDVGEMVWSWYNSVAEPLFKFFHNTIADAESWSDVFGPIFDGVVEKLGDFERGLWELPGPLGEAAHTFSLFGGSVKRFVGDVVLPKVKNIFDSLKTYISSFDGLSIKDSILKLFKDLKTKLQEIIPKIPGMLADFKNSFMEALPKIQTAVKDFFTNIFANMPSPDEILSGIGTFFSNIKSSIGGFASGLGSTEGFGSILSGMFDFSNVNLDFSNLTSIFEMISDFAGKFMGPLSTILKAVKDVLGKGFSAIGEFLSDIIATIPTDDLESLFDFVSKILEKAIKAGFIFQAFRLLNSIVSLNKGIGKFGKNFRKGLEGLGEGLKDFGSGFTKFKKQTKAQAFMRIATGILILAGALFVISKIPADRLQDAASTLLYLGVASAALIVLSAAVAKLAKLDLEGVGKAVGGFGIGLLALAVAAVIFSKIPSENFAKAIGGLVAALIFLAGGIALIAKAGGNVEGVGKAALGMAAAITLLLIPITILGLMPIGILAQGMVATGLMLLVLGLAIGIIARMNKYKSSVLSAGAALLGLAIAVNLMIIPIEILGHADPGVLKQGGFAVGQIALLLGAVVALIGFFGKNAGGMLAAIPLMLSFALVIVVLKGVIESIGTMPTEVLETGRMGLLQMSVLLGVALVVMTLCGTLGEGLGKAALAIAIFGGVIAALLYVMGEIAKIVDMHPEGMTTAIGALVVIVLAIAGLGLVGKFAFTGLALCAAGIALIAVSLGLLEAVINAFNVDGFVDGLKRIGDSTTDTAGTVVSGFVGGIAKAAGEFIKSGVEMASNFLSGLLGPSGIDSNSPSKKTEEAGENSAEGFLNGVASFFGQILGSGEETGGNFLDGLADLPDKLATKASEAISTFIENLDTEGIVSKGNDIVQGLIDGIKSSAWESLKAIPGEIFHAIVDPILSFFGIASPSAYMRDTVGANIVQGLIDGIRNFFGPLGDAAGGIVSAVKNGAGGLLQTGIDKAKDFGGNLLNGIKGFVGGARTSAESVSNGAVSGLNTLKSNVTTKARDAMTSFVQSFTNKISSVRSASSSLVTAAKNGLNNLKSSMRTLASNATSAFSSAISSGVGSVRNAASNLYSAAKSGLGSLYSSFYSTGSSAGRGLRDGISSWASSVRSTMSSLLSSVINTAHKILKINSPSKVFRSMGYSIGEGLVMGIDRYSRPVQRVSEALAETAIDSFSMIDLSAEDLIDTDLHPVITPIVNPAEFDTSMSRLSASLGTLSAMSVGNLNYTQEMSAKFTDYMDANEAAIEAMARNAIDYDRLGVSVASALINAGFHVEMDGGELMGYLAGQISDTRRMYAAR